MARGEAQRSDRMAPADLPALPAEVIERIACALLVAEGATPHARRELSVVCRAWRDILPSEQSALNLIPCASACFNDVFSQCDVTRL